MRPAAALARESSKFRASLDESDPVFAQGTHRISTSLPQTPEGETIALKDPNGDVGSMWCSSPPRRRASRGAEILLRCKALGLFFSSLVVTLGAGFPHAGSALTDCYSRPDESTLIAKQEDQETPAASAIVLSWQHEHAPEGATLNGRSLRPLPDSSRKRGGMSKSHRMGWDYDKPTGGSMAENSQSQAPGANRPLRGTLSLTFHVADSVIRLEAYERVDMICPPSVGERPQAGKHGGFWMELRDGDDRVLFHRVLNNPLGDSVEVHSPDGKILAGIRSSKRACLRGAPAG